MSVENPKNPTWFGMFRNMDNGEPTAEAEISIYDNIGGFGVTANDFIAALKNLGDVETINLRIASGGGSIVEGNTIYNALKRHSAKIITHVDSLAASMASVIAMAGDEVRMAENALLMIHNPWTMSIGGADQLRKDADLLDKMESNIRTSYARSNLSAEELDAAMEAETYYTAAEALEAGFIDAIDGANLAAASIGDMETLKDFASVPQAKIDGIKIECQARQIESLSVQLDEVRGELECRDEALAFANASIETLKADAETLKTEHAEALEKATEQTAQAISNKAAELLAESGVPPIENEPEKHHGEQGSKGKMTEEQFWAEYREFDKRGDYEGKNIFYQENKHVLGQ
jgi:ATP-dependent protease ClpP protease subunit